MFPTPNKDASRGALLLFFRRLHFYIGLFVGPFIFIAALTGTLYVITPQLENALFRTALLAEDSGTALPLSRQIDAARQFIGEEAKLYAVRPAPEPNATTRVQFSDPTLGPYESRAIFVSPYTLKIQGDMTVYGTSGILPLRTWIDQFHRGLLLGDVGRNYSELAASWMWVAALGGVVLWLGTRPKRQRKKIRSRAATLRRWHISLGVVLLAGLVFFSATGLTWSQWAGGNIDKLRTGMGWLTPQVNTALNAAAGHVPADPHAEHHGSMAGMMMPEVDNTTWDGVLLAARRAGLASARVEIRPAGSASKAWTVTEIDRSWPTHVDSVAVDPQDFRVTDKVHFADFPLIAKLTRWGIDAHMGILFGLPNQLLLLAFGLGVCVMIIIGYRMWWHRRPVPSAVNPAQTLSEAWRNLPLAWRTVLLACALLLGVALPVMGISLLLFLLVDIVRWRAAVRSRLTVEASMLN